MGLILCMATQVISQSQSLKTIALEEQLYKSSADSLLFGASAMRNFTKNHPYKPLIYHSSTVQPTIPATALAPVFYRIDTQQPVIFITIDDGVTPEPSALHLIRQNHVVASLFLYRHAVWRHSDYFRLWQSAGSIIENHTLSHPHLKNLTFLQQKEEICSNANAINQMFGSRPTLFRPPYGEFNNDTRQATNECGMKALVCWSVTVKDGNLHYQGTDRLRPGDIVLLHFTPQLAGDLKILLAQASIHHLQIGKLEEWLR